MVRATLPLVLSVAALLTLSVAGDDVLVSYSDQPLKDKPFMSTAEVAVDSVRFNNWLVEHHASIPNDRLTGPREHAYLLIDSVLKIHQAEGRAEFNEFERTVLAQSFNWATHLGVFGSGLVARELAADKSKQTEDPLLPPKPFQLKLEFPHFVLSSAEAPWKVRLPYYFMIWEAKRFTTTAGALTDLVMISTLFGRHKAREGKSQATIMFMFSPGTECRTFEKFWLDQLGIKSKQKTASSPLPRSRHFETYDGADTMHKEVTLLGDETGCYALAYLGMDGPYQVNRVNYLDFIKSLQRADETSNNRMNLPTGGRLTADWRPRSPAAG